MVSVGERATGTVAVIGFEAAALSRRSMSGSLGRRYHSVTVATVLKHAVAQVLDSPLLIG